MLNNCGNSTGARYLRVIGSSPGSAHVKQHSLPMERYIIQYAVVKEPFR